MKKEINELINKAERSVKAASRLLQQGDFDFATSRAYYAMFYMAEAVLLTKGLSFSKHKGVISKFNQHFVKTGIFDYKYYDMLDFAFEQRNISDYESFQQISKETAQEWVGIDASEEVEKLKGEQDDINNNPENPDNINNPNNPNNPDNQPDPLAALKLKSKIKKQMKSGGSND